MGPFVDDLQRADALPEQPPEGAMSYNEFIRSSINDSGMRTLTTIIDHILVDELRTQESREFIFQEICAGRKDLRNGIQELVGNDRNTSCQRIGYLVGYATAMGIDSDTLTRARAIFAGRDFTTQVANRAADTANNRHGANGNADMTEASEASGTIETNSTDRWSGRAEANGPEDTNGTGNADNTAVTNGNSVAIGNGEASTEDDTPPLSPLGGGVVIDSEV